MPSRSETKLLRSLSRRKGREAHGLLLLEGPRLLVEALASPCRPVRVLHTAEAAADPACAPALERARAAGAAVERVRPQEIAALADTVTPQGVIAVVERPEWRWSDVTGSRLLVLDGVQDPGNAGTLVRTAEAMGVAGVLLLPGTADAWSPKLIRAAAGSSLRLPLLPCGREEAAAGLRARRYDVWVAEPGGDPVHRGDPVPPRLALVLGGEGGGVSAEMRGSAQRRVAIPLAAPVESLNVAVAGAILLDRLFGEETRPGAPGRGA